MRRLRRFASALARRRGDLAMIAVFAALCLGLAQLRLSPPVRPGGEKVRAEVLAVDDSQLQKQGMLTVGEELLTLRLLDGARRGETVDAVNQLRGRLDMDKLFRPGDRALAAVPRDAGPHTVVNAQDHYRLDLVWWLFGLFALLLVGFGGLTGVKALVSFVFACLTVWKLLVPLCLRGWPPVWTSLAAVTLLAAAIIFIVAGVRGKGLTAFFGTLLGVAVSAALAEIFTRLFHLHGAVMPFAESLYYAGYDFLNLTDLYIGAVFLGSSGAVMDLAMDVAAGMEEVVRHRPDIRRAALVASGFRIGRMVVGTMTTTLLLAYSGGYLTLIMAFAAEGTGPVDFLNYPYVAAEIVRTLVGSLGLVLVAPFTALAGGLLLTGQRRSDSGRNRTENRT